MYVGTNKKNRGCSASRQMVLMLHLKVTMTRVLSELLGANEPVFRSGISRLERVSGHPNTDIRLSTELAQATRRKLRELGLDPRDTTGKELYNALQARFAADNERLLARLHEKHEDHDDITCIAEELRSIPIPKSCFVLKTASAKRLLKAHPPKKALKQLGYRSFDSMLKHEGHVGVYAAAWLTESATWRRQLIDSYKKLRATDFEIRDLQIVAPHSDRWEALVREHIGKRRHNVISFKELGAVVLLPLPEQAPPGAAVTSLLLALQDMNELRAVSTFLKLHHVKPSFGAVVQMAVKEDPTLSAQLLDRDVSWQVIQRYYGRFADRFKAELFEPHVQLDDLTWHSIEKVLAYIDPSLAFWRHTTHLSVLRDHQPVSLNIIDVALAFCNKLSFEERVSRYFQSSLWHELIIRYLKHENVEHTVLAGLRSELVPEVAQN